MASHGTGPFEDRTTSSVISASGIRFKKLKLIAPVTALNANKAANCPGPGLPARQAAASKKVKKLARFWTAPSRDKYLPLKFSGTNAVIQGNHAQLEMPRDKLKQNSSMSMRPSRLCGSKKRP